MNYEEIATAPATLSTNVSQGLFYELIQSDWRCYTPFNYANTPSLIRRFLAAHARIPGIASSDMLGIVPLHILRWWIPDRTVMMEGAVFLNGAVLSVHAPGAITPILLVNELTAEQWGYPDAYADGSPVPTPGQDL